MNVPNGTPPPNLEDVQLSFVPGVLFDNPPVGHQFGDCLLQPPSLVYKGEMVKVRYNNQLTNFSKIAISMKLPNYHQLLYS